MIATYTRTSTNLQAQNNSDAAQVEAIRRWCAANGHDYDGAAHFADAGKSGKNMKRLEFQRMLEAVRAGTIDAVVVWNLSRAGRSLLDLLTWLNEMQERGVRVVFIYENIDTGTPMGRLLLGVVGALAEFQREQYRENTRQGIAAFRGKDKRWGGARRVSSRKGFKRFTDARECEIAHESGTLVEIAERHKCGQTTVVRFRSKWLLGPNRPADAATPPAQTAGAGESTTDEPVIQG